MIPQFDKIFRETQDAIVATGKKFKDIPKDSIQSFLKAKGLASSEIGDKGLSLGKVLAVLVLLIVVFILIFSTV